MALAGTVALVTGASRGIGKGIALELGAAGATVYVTGREPSQASNLPNTSTLAEVAEEVSKAGGRGIVAYCDHSQPADVKRLFERIALEQDGRLDLLVNNAYSAVQFISKHVGQKFYEFAEAPEDAWDVVNNVGLRNHYVCSVYAARMMVPRRSGLIVTVSSPGGLKHLFNLPYGVGKAACDRLAADMAVELAEAGVCSVSLWPGAVRTEAMQQAQTQRTGPEAQLFAAGESIRFAGRCVARWAADPRRRADSGRILLTNELAQRYDVADLDGAQPLNPFFEAHKRYADFLNQVRTADIRQAGI